MTKGKIIVIEGTDCSFKETNTKRLYEYIKENITDKVKLISFPNYDSNSSYFIKRYLSGEYGNPIELNPYTSSMFFAMDRLDTVYRENINELYNDGYILIFDRYVGSNIIHQSAKFKSLMEIESFIKWIKKLEYIDNKLPQEDICICLGLNSKYHEEVLKSRDNKSVDNDGHEADSEYQKRLCDYIVPFISGYMGWGFVPCYNDTENRLKTKNEIFEGILSYIKFD